MKPYSKTTEVRRSQPLLGTFVEITAMGVDRKGAQEAVSEAFSVVQKVQQLMSFFDEESEVSRLNRLAWRDRVRVHPWTYEVLEQSLRMSVLSNGIFDITGPSHSEQRKSSLSSKSNRGSLVGYEQVELLRENQVFFRKPGLQIDLGGIAKGFAVDRAVETLKNHGIESALVNAGGDICGFGPRVFPITLRDPGNPRVSIATLPVFNVALANSGSYFQDHLVFPRKQNDSSPFAAAGVQARNCMDADALTKVVILQGFAASEILEKCGAIGYIVDRNGQFRFLH